MSKQNYNFVMKEYGKQSTFASFLPGIAGVRGIPIWCYYVNRGQGVVSFGVENKDHAIMEFSPAHRAYQMVETTGFRTFLRKNGVMREAFAGETVPKDMEIQMNILTLKEQDVQDGIDTEVSYFVLPEERVGALVRMVTVTNTSDEACEIEILDGMPEVIPYGVDEENMKNMLQTAKAWMQAEDVDTKVPYYRVRASIVDSATVKEVLGGNFAAGFDEKGNRLYAIADANVVFSYDTSLKNPVVFREGGLKAVMQKKQNTSNLLPCAFFGTGRELKSGESMTICEMIGQVEKKEVLQEYLKNDMSIAYFWEKKERARILVEELCGGVATQTANEKFDQYCEYNYMDNVLRGGHPMRLGNNKVFYVYSRKHGDLERDYNYFSMLPEYYSQGNGNFRDVNQNRRCDTFFAPFVARQNIYTFYSLIRLDGYNPLGIGMMTYEMEKDKADALLAGQRKEIKEELYSLITRPFTPGKLYEKLESMLEKDTCETLFLQIIDFAEETVNGKFGEGYWSDHWTYNLDLVEEYASIFPEKEKEMLYEKNYTWFVSQVNVNPRIRRYEVTEKGIRQYHALMEESRRSTTDKLLKSNYGMGEVLSSSLMEKLLLLCAVKFATLDAYGMGIEMEGGKPGWYDALNGMPAMLGSSMAETYELARMLAYTREVLLRYPGEVTVLKEIAEFIRQLGQINASEQSQLKGQKQVLTFWNKINDAKENYRNKTFAGVSGQAEQMLTAPLYDILGGFEKTVQLGIEKAKEYGQGIVPTYFTYEITDYEKTKEGIVPLRFEVQQVTYFLEGPVRYLKTNVSKHDKRTLYRNIKNSDLYDEKLSMYKVNASLQEASYELGRARAFTPGWLENESIWLHMEYKYLLELLRSGLYEEFTQDFEKAAVPFMDEKIYGRSTLENSEFLVYFLNFPVFTGFLAHQHLCILHFSLIFSLVRKL